MRTLRALLISVVLATLALVGGSGGASAAGGAFWWDSGYGGWIDSNCTLGSKLVIVLHDHADLGQPKTKVCSNQSDFRQMERSTEGGNPYGGNFNDKVSKIKVINWTGQTSLCKALFYRDIDYQPGVPVGGDGTPWEVQYVRYNGTYDAYYNDAISSMKFNSYCTF